jgi:hypothetical protein
MNAKIEGYRYLIFLALIIAVFSCKKSTENKLAGTWKLINVENILDTTSVEKWQFDSDGNLQMLFYKDGGSSSFSNSAWRYTLISYKKLSIKSNDSASYSQDWDILKLKKDVLVMANKSGGLLQKEFVKL